VAPGAEFEHPVRAHALRHRFHGIRGRGEVGANAATKLLMLSGVPLGQPVVQYGPFVMDTGEEIYRAIQDL